MELDPGIHIGSTWFVLETGCDISIAGAGCGLTGDGAGEEQVRKVVADEASRCGEDK
jgi:hypothetical protein